MYCPQNKDSCSQGIYADGSRVIDSCPLTCKTCTSKLIKNGGTSKISFFFLFKGENSTTTTIRTTIRTTTTLYPPGFVPTADDQCKMTFGSNGSFCHV